MTRATPADDTAAAHALHPVRKGLRAVAALLCGAVAALVITVPMDLAEQALFGGACFAAALAIRHRRDRAATLAMVLLSVVASVRYMYWRLTETVGFETWLDSFFGIGLVLAELYALAVLLMGYIQTAWPLDRKPVALPVDSSTWPSVDVFIPTYNEPLDVVRQTVLTAMGMDWPHHKLHIHVLDDGKRAEFGAFCKEAGVGYLTREDNRHAKAGNINAALARTSAEYVAIFDCDHIPTRSFLQITMGWFLKDSKLSLLQTPHFFFSPDPFEKNLDTFRIIPNEGELFYGLVQDGNDLWNATFFCGSCAVIRRAPLLEVGGIAVETVTEDAHTALKLSRLGYNTAYLAIPQAGGLATESLSGHIGQRIRWARGMAQIARVDNPLLGPGLTLGQRLCYFNAMLHFFYGLPRLVFLTAPLAYLFFDAHVFQATALLILSYALPHLAHATITNSRMQGRFRHSFWNEVYETVLAWYILRPVLMAVINPKLGKFNVTAKGGVIPESYFDWPIARPLIVLVSLNALGIVLGLWHLSSTHGTELTTLWINMAWSVYNIAIAAAAIAVANEAQQVRRTPRVASSFAASLALPDGHVIACTTRDFSQFGVELSVPAEASVAPGERLDVALFRGDDEGVFPATVISRQGTRVGLRFDELSIDQQRELSHLTFARADNWVRHWGATNADRPLYALGSVLVLGVRGLGLLLMQTYRRMTPVRSARGAASMKLEGRS